MWQTYLQPTTLDDALALLAEHGERARIVAGGTDVLVELSRGQRPTATLIDVTAILGLKYVREEDGLIRLGALATHNDVVASPLCRERALPLVQACWEVGAPQLRTRGTVAGNLVTGSPANDTITPLVALDAEIVLTRAGGERIVPIAEFYLGVRRTTIRPDELLREIRFPALAAEQRGIFLKLGLRRAQAISVIDLALVVSFDGDRVRDARVALGSLAPTIVRATAVEAFLVGRRLDAETRAEAGRLARAAVSPIDDVRGSAAYRLATLENLVAHALERIAAGSEADDPSPNPVLLDSQPFSPSGHSRPRTNFAGTIHTTINGEARALTGAAGKTLLDALREDAGLTGTKEGCVEGECGACTVWLDGQAVMACLVPAAQAHNATVTTIEGLAGGDGLHPLQRAFVDRGAVQCGYCIPGMLMAGAKLLAERPAPGPEDVRVALSGNLCRCTGYRKILDAVLAAAETAASPLAPEELRRFSAGHQPRADANPGDRP
ncbi:MAG: FAD binding domain-containing protein [Chloroflexota bacterium]|nr:FAD binding domain-containing protein [Chloroflexota bacterium]